MESAFVVLLRDGAPKDWLRAADIVDRASPTLGRADATRTCRFGHGLILIPLPLTEAEQLAAALTAGGFAAEALALTEIVVAPKAFTIPRADLSTDGLALQTDAAGKTSMLPWSALRILHLSYVKPTGGRLVLPEAKLQEDQAEALATAMLQREDASKTVETIGQIGIMAATFGLAAIGGPRLLSTLAMHDAIEEFSGPGVVPAGAAPPTPKNTEPEVWLELLALEPLLRLRIRRHAFRYDYLAERRQASGKANFRLLVKDMAQGAAHAARAGQFEAVLKGADPEQARLLCDEKDHELAISALLTREKRYGLPQEPASKPA